MSTVTRVGAMTHLGHLLDQVDEEVVITRRGRPVARITPVEKPGQLISPSRNSPGRCPAAANPVPNCCGNCEMKGFEGMLYFETSFPGPFIPKEPSSEKVEAFTNQRVALMQRFSFQGSAA